MQRGKVNIVIDGQWGSTGKGKLVGWLVTKEREVPEVSVCDFQTNAGHTVVMNDGTKHIFQQLPVAAINPDIKLIINAGASITVPKLLAEIETHRAQKRLSIHPHAGVVTDACRAWEEEELNRISSTKKGAGACSAFKVMRSRRATLAKDVPELLEWINPYTDEILTQYLRRGVIVLGESAQGYDLSLNYGFQYPYVTSRDVNVCSFMSNANLPASFIGDVYGCIRTYPIRVGNQFDANGVQIGTSGPCYDDQIEISWEDLRVSSGAMYDLVEKTTVTQKVRRVFTFSDEQFIKFVRACDPSHIFINFMNHVNAKDGGVTKAGALSDESKNFFIHVKSLLERHAENKWACIKYLGTGAAMRDMVAV